jgi:alkaline phosphatase
MVEGGRIDHAGHANWARTLVDETAAFDEAIGYAVDRLDPKTTLVLVTADHETGGLSINGYPDEKDGIWSAYRDPWGEKGDEPYPVLTFSSGPGTKRQTRQAPYGADDPRPSGLSLGSAAHTGVDVVLYAWGAGAERVHGTLENTSVYTILREHLEGKPYGR